MAINKLYETLDKEATTLKQLLQIDVEVMLNYAVDLADHYGVETLMHNYSDRDMAQSLISFYNKDYEYTDINVIHSAYGQTNQLPYHLFDFNNEHLYAKHTREQKKNTLRWGIQINNLIERGLFTNNSAFLNTFYRPFVLNNAFKTNFSPKTAKILYQKWCPAGGVIYDYSIGFGGRMTGAGCCKENYLYLGTDPNTKNTTGYKTLSGILQTINPNFRTDLKTIGSEVYVPEWEGLVDYAFSSPPYFSLEWYTDEPTQAYIKFKGYEGFFDGYWRGTLRNIRKYLRPHGKLGINAKNVKGLGNIYDDFIRVAIEEGFEVIDDVYTGIATGAIWEKRKNNPEHITTLKIK